MKTFIIKAVLLLLSLSMLVSCNKDSITGKSLVGKWEFHHFEYTTTSGEVIKKTLDATIYWTFTDKMVTIQEKDSYGEDDATYSYTYEDGVLLINTYFKTMITESPLLGVDRINKSELVLLSEQDFWPHTQWINGQVIDVAKCALVFNRVK